MCRDKQIRRRGLAYQDFYKKNVVSSILTAQFAHVTADLRACIVRATIDCLDTASKEIILHNCMVVPFYQIMAHHGFFHVHAAAVAIDDSCVLLTGPSSSGKSTLSVTLARKGFSLIADDDCFLKLGRIGWCVFPFQTKMGVKRQLLARHPDLRKRLVKNFQYGGRLRASFKSRSPSIDKNVCKAIIFPKYRTVGRLEIRRMSRASGVDQLIRGTVCSYPEHDSRNTVWAFYQASQTVSFYELLYNDKHLSKIPTLIEDVLKRSASQP
jgi:hypothetical protein